MSGSGKDMYAQRRRLEVVAAEEMGDAERRKQREVRFNTGSGDSSAVGGWGEGHKVEKRPRLKQGTSDHKQVDVPWNFYSRSSGMLGGSAACAEAAPRSDKDALKAFRAREALSMRSNKVKKNHTKYF